MANAEQLDILYKLKKEVEKSQNQNLVHIINQVIKKVYLEQYTATFVGHFSAGKSTLINSVLEENILPSSPVPTTSNTAIVSVSDEPGIIANLDKQRYTILDNYEQVKIMNRENVDVESVEIKFDSKKFNKGFTLQDTPGVDSNVATHQSSTEQFMYTSNIIFYTVDYNHVQSALNFEFMKRLNKAGVPVVFVINQIDKHNEDEIAFETFKARVEKSVNDWDIDLADIFYVSKFRHPHNQMEELSDYLVNRDRHREPIEDYVERIVQFITEQQLSYIQTEIQQILDKLDIQEEEFDQAYLNFQQHKEVSEEAQLLNNPEQLYNFLKQKRKDILDNAYVMTHDTRETIRLYLESRTKDFKVGGLFNKKRKTAEAQEERLNNVIDQLQEKVNQQIRQPLREDMSFLTRFINDSEVNERILNQHYTVYPELVTSLYQEQINISNQYVLTFSDETMKSIKQFIKRETEPLFKDATDHAQAEDLASDDEQDMNAYEEFIQFRNLRESLTTHNYKHYYIHLHDSLDKLIDRTEIQYQPSSTTEVSNDEQHHNDSSGVDSTQDRTNEIVNGLNTIKDIPLFEQTKKDIAATLSRLEDKVIKIGVFGTFSAGKSSLINALLGDSYLVSSPNPTTAATTELTYGEDSAITLKSEEQLLEELNDVFELHDESFSSIESFVSSNTKKLKTKLEKNQLAFINAIEQNYNEFKEMLSEGTRHSINQDEIRKWSSEDEYATFVNTVHIQLPIDWLKDKIIIDSLGLHSNNQRHTNETEKILTSSDLILYVSYFNHSFTDNDKRFIEHMKDMNQLNENQAFKMIINATDLAESDEDLVAVKNYVRDALKQVNMHSDIFGVSSREALKKGDRGIDELKESITTFAEIESKGILQQHMLHQLTQISLAYDEMIDEFETNKAQLVERQQKLEKLSKERVLNPNVLNIVEQRSVNEVEDQIYHLTQRLNLQLLDEVKAIYNSQMTRSDDFNKEKRRVTKLYLDEIHQRLYLEQSLLVERTKKYYLDQLEGEFAPIQQTLNHVHVFVDPEFNIADSNIEEPYMQLELNTMFNALPKSLTKKKIIQPKVQRDVQQQITENTTELLQPQISNLRQALVNYISEMVTTSESDFDNLEKDIQSQLEELLSFEIDESLINQIHVANQQLKSNIQLTE
ncbi:dynamin family protein [Staphylococcus sp. SQ8-PEA]|uniref:Dynamin family protein n=1 Tax=Staphylococcus marylandisciuri TaxID=2981529 RepID=A0ABT2QNG2_9STAP|nr:dynamin family protein [Staphylococcus marylandisciuri]MCU5745508.1 dynamin family protein [Staphylococcus marylandisciuri]